MRLAFLFTVIQLVLASTAAAQGAPAPAAPAAPPEGPRYIVTYVDVVPASEAQAVNLLKSYRDTTRKAEGSRRADIWRQESPRGRFLIVEEWQDDATRKKHRESSHVAQFLEKLTPLRVTAYDERTHTNFNIASQSSAPADAVLVATHVDVVPNGLPKARELLQGQVSATRMNGGNLRFDVLQGARPNHFTVLEAWRDERAREGHVSASHTKTYREGLRETAVDGAPYDERLYRLVP